MTDQGSQENVTHRGSCHCGDVKFRVQAAPQITAQACNCSICRMTGFIHLIVPARDFELLSDPTELSEYTFNTGQAKHRFCQRCGVKSFYVPRSNPDGYSINVRCLDLATVAELTVEPFDGQNWEANAAELKHLSN